MSRTSPAITVLPCLLTLIGGAMLIGGGDDRNAEPPKPATEKPVALPDPQSAGTAAVDAPRVDESLYVDLLEQDLTPPQMPSKKIRRALEKRITVEFTDEPLHKALATIGKLAGFAVKIGEESLTEEGVELDEPVTLPKTKLRAEQLLRVILEPLALSALAEGDQLMVTTYLLAEERLLTTTYDLRPLIDLGFTHSAIADLIQSNTSGPWMEWDGIGGGIWMIGNSMVVRQQYTVHREIESVLRILKVAAATARDTGILPFENPLDSADLVAIDRGLSRRISIDYRKKPLEEAVADLAKRAGLQILIDKSALAEEAVDLDEPITLRLKDVIAQTALKRSLEPLGLTYIYEDGLLKVTTELIAEEMQMTLVYIVRDLYEEGYSGWNLIDILHTFSGSLWEGVDGFGGSITEAAWGLLVVRQTVDAHGDVSEVLAEVREMLANSKRPLIVPVGSSKPKLVTRVYQTEPIPPPEKTEKKAEEKETKEKKDEQEQSKVQPPRPRPPVIDDLVKVIPTFLAPKSWEQTGGKGRIGKVGSLLIVHQTEDLQQSSGWGSGRGAVGCGFGTMENSEEWQTEGQNGGELFGVGESTVRPMAVAQFNGSANFYARSPFHGSLYWTAVGWDYAEQAPPVKPKRPANVKLTDDEKSWILERPNFVHSRRADEKELREALEKKLTIQFEKTPLKEALHRLADQGGINVLIDRVSLSEEGTSVNEPVSAKFENVTLREVFDQILTPLESSWHIDGNVVDVTTKEAAIEEMDTSPFNARPLLEAGYSQATLQETFNDVLIDDEYWSTDLEPFLVADYLVFPRPLENRKLVEKRLNALTTIAKGRRTKGMIPLWHPKTMETRKALNGPVELQRIDEPLSLRDAVDRLTLASGVPIHVHFATCGEGDKPRYPFVIAQFLPLRGTLGQMLDSMMDNVVLSPTKELTREKLRGLNRLQLLTYAVVDGEISIRENFNLHPELAIYNVRDLAELGLTTENFTRSLEQSVPWELLSNKPRFQFHEPIPGTWLVWTDLKAHLHMTRTLQRLRTAVAQQDAKNVDLSALKPDHGPHTRTYRFIEQLPAADLASVIPRFVEPKHWQADSGVKIQKVGDQLIIRQSERVHRRIEKFLRMLHKEYRYNYSDGLPYKKGEPKPGSGLGFF